MTSMPPRRRPRIALSVRVRRDLADRLRVLVRDEAGSPLYLTVSGFVEAAIEAHLIAVQRQLDEHRRGGRPSPDYLNGEVRRRSP